MPPQSFDKETVTTSGQLRLTFLSVRTILVHRCSTPTQEEGSVRDSSVDFCPGCTLADLLHDQAKEEASCLESPMSAVQEEVASRISDEKYYPGN
jgi:hypothetical protein